MLPVKQIVNFLICHRKILNSKIKQNQRNFKQKQDQKKSGKLQAHKPQACERQQARNKNLMLKDNLHDDERASRDCMNISDNYTYYHRVPSRGNMIDD